MKSLDRNSLYKYAIPLYKALNEEHSLTHFYFHNPDRINFLRVHQPDRYGDTINRYSTVEAQRTQKIASAIEVGPLGLFTLRVVFPWYDNGKLLGYIELGEEVEHLFETLKESTSVELFVSLEKGILSQGVWESTMKKLGREAEWDFLKESVIAYTSIPESKKIIQQYMQEGKSLKQIKEILLDNRIFKTDTMILTTPDQSEKIGQLVFLYDISDMRSYSKEHIVIATILGSAVVGILILFFFFLIRHIEYLLASAEKNLISSEARFRALVESSSDLIWEVDTSGRYTYISPKIKELLGYEVSAVIGKKVFSLLSDGELQRISNLYSAMIKEGKAFSSIENIHKHKDGHEIVIETSGVPILDAEHTVIGYRGINRDITKRKDAENKITHMAYYDALTSLPNRTLFQDRLNQDLRIADRSKRLVGILFMDMDNFKDINDTLGHEVGDMLLQSIASRLKHTLRSSDTIARFGGDEFAMIIPELMYEEGINKVLKNITESFKEPFSIHKNEFFVTFSIGYNFYPLDDINTNNLLRNSDTAMYYAKKEGKNCSKRYTAQMTERVRNNNMIQVGLRRAIKDEELVLYYQPQIDLQKGVLNGVEALIRWQDPKEGLKLPGAFISIAEETGLIVPMGEWIIRKACTDAKA